MNINRCRAEARVTVPVTMPATWMMELNRLAASRGITRSALVRQALVALSEMPDGSANNHQGEAIR